MNFIARFFRALLGLNAKTERDRVVRASAQKASSAVSVSVADDYRRLFLNLEVEPARVAALEKWVATLLAGRPAYELIDKQTGVPWWVIGLIHGREGSFNFKTHLHNGDPLAARTRNVPAGRPKSGEPPFSFAESAADALAHDGLANQTDWSLCAALNRLELFNGAGYRRMGMPSPYLWSWAKGQPRGKFVRDGVFSATAVDEQPGAGTALHILVQRGIVQF